VRSGEVDKGGTSLFRLNRNAEPEKIASTAGMNGPLRLVSYATFKAALNAFTKVLASAHGARREGGKDGNARGPGDHQDRWQRRNRGARPTRISLEDLQAAVGGCIQVVPGHERGTFRRQSQECLVYCDEEASSRVSHSIAWQSSSGAKARARVMRSWATSRSYMGIKVPAPSQRWRVGGGDHPWQLSRSRIAREGRR
jgi:hypothetical protein